MRSNYVRRHDQVFYRSLIRSVALILKTRKTLTLHSPSVKMLSFIAVLVTGKSLKGVRKGG